MNNLVICSYWEDVDLLFVPASEKDAHFSLNESNGFKIFFDDDDAQCFVPSHFSSDCHLLSIGWLARDTKIEVCSSSQIEIPSYYGKKKKQKKKKKGEM